MYFCCHRASLKANSHVKLSASVGLKACNQGAAEARVCNLCSRFCTQLLAQFLTRGSTLPGLGITARASLSAAVIGPFRKRKKVVAAAGANFCVKFCTRAIFHIFGRKFWQVGRMWPPTATHHLQPAPIPPISPISPWSTPHTLLTHTHAHIHTGLSHMAQLPIGDREKI